MKKVIFVLLASLMMTSGFAQSEKYMKAMGGLVVALDTTRSIVGLTDLANSFERIANAEKTEWLPFYYAALSTINAAYSYSDGTFGDKSVVMDPLAEKAEAFLNKAEETSKNNSEIWLVRKIIASVRMMANPMARYQQYSPIATEALETAKKLNPDNPRVYLQEGQDLYFTPEQFGGDKQEAKKRFETTVSKFDIYKPESPIHPNWGLGTAKYFLSQIK
jgi:hypothetical protein